MTARRSGRRIWSQGGKTKTAIAGGVRPGGALRRTGAWSSRTMPAGCCIESISGGDAGARAAGQGHGHVRMNGDGLSALPVHFLLVWRSRPGEIGGGAASSFAPTKVSGLTAVSSHAMVGYGGDYEGIESNLDR